MKDILKYIAPGLIVLLLGMGFIASNYNSDVGIYIVPPAVENYGEQTAEKENGEIGIYAEAEEQEETEKNPTKDIHRASGYEEENDSFFEATKNWFNEKIT